MEISWNIVIGLATLIVGLFTLKYARKAWLEPVPFLEFDKGKAVFALANNRYVAEISVSVTNTSAVPALFKQILINGKRVAEETMTVEIGDTPRNIRSRIRKVTATGEGAILIPEPVKRQISAVVFFKEKPSKIKVQVVTPNRRFTTTIENIKEESIDWLPSLIST